MYKQLGWISFIVFFIFLFFFVNATPGTQTGNVFAQENNNQIPITKTSNQWSVVIGQPIKSKHTIEKPNSNLFDTYSLNLKNIGKTAASDVRVEIFKHEEQEPQTKMMLFSNEIDLIDSNQGVIINNQFPLSKRSKELEVVVSWEEEPITNKDGNKIKGRTLRQIFVFMPHKNS